MRALLLLGFAGFLAALPASPQASDPTVQFDFSNPGLTPPKWTMLIHPDGSAHFHADPGDISAAKIHDIEPPMIDRDLTLSKGFTDGVFATVHHGTPLREGCESHLKVAFQGSKTITYSGPDGQGSCEFNYAKSKDIQSLSTSIVAVAATLVEGARLELLLQHDPLGLDQEMEYVKEAAADGRLQQLSVIQGILTKLEDDPGVMERVRKRARMLLSDSSPK